ncbi:MAG: 50S ribosomal protein L4 [Candidatus Pacearchaeota archaeon]|nr:50S ribosomal protein L4 [Candidatus Pacearchaeota archaeon]
MKAKILGTQEEIELPKVFEETVRKDIVEKIYNAMFTKQRYTVYPIAGKQSSSGKQSHTRRKFKTLYGKGISRVPRKTMSRRGDQFSWVGTFMPGTVKGRAAHPPKLGRTERVINKKEKVIALKSCIAASASKKILEKNYKNFNATQIPIIIKSSLLEKPKEILKLLEENNVKTHGERKVRSGKGKVRGRKYKNIKKILLILGNKENPRKIKNFFNFEKVQQLNIKKMSLNGEPGKIIVYTDYSLKEIADRFK